MYQHTNNLTSTRILELFLEVCESKDWRACQPVYGLATWIARNAVRLNSDDVTLLITIGAILVDRQMEIEWGSGIKPRSWEIQS